MAVDKELVSQKELHYGDIWDCPHAELMITARILDKARRLTQKAYLSQVLKDFGHIPEVKNLIGDINKIEEDTIKDLEGYLFLLKKRKD